MHRSRTPFPFKAASHQPLRRHLPVRRGFRARFHAFFWNSGSGAGVAPQLMFACCDHGMSQMQSPLTNANVIANLKSLHAGLGVAIVDFTPERAELVRRLNWEGIPVIAGLGMPPEQGFYFNAENAPAAAARFAAFDAWSREQGLRWDAVGLDIEPNFAELGSLNGHWWRLFTTFLWRAADVQRLYRAQRVYSALIANIRPGVTSSKPINCRTFLSNARPTRLYSTGCWAQSTFAVIRKS